MDLFKLTDEDVYKMLHISNLDENLEDFELPRLWVGYAIQDIGDYYTYEIRFDSYVEYSWYTFDTIVNHPTTQKYTITFNKLESLYYSKNGFS